ncbi:MAG: hypothetical protein ACREDR_49515, partial [Blastocatellia bacterium]
MKKLAVLYALMPCVLLTQAMAQTSKPATAARPTIETVIKVLNVGGMTSREIERLAKSESEMDKAIASGKATLAADVRIVQQSGELGN